MLHARRRRRAAGRLRERQRPESVLFLCLGNVCRSPYAARAFRRALERRASNRPSVRVASAGFSGWDRPPPPEAVAEARSRGVDLDEHRSRPVAYDLVDSTDLFVVSDGRQAAKLRRTFGVPASRILHLGDLDPAPLRHRTVEDPWDGGRDAFRRAYDRIDRCVERLAELVTKES